VRKGGGWGAGLSWGWGGLVSWNRVQAVGGRGKALSTLLDSLNPPLSIQLTFSHPNQPQPQHT